ncbi:MerR family transcriptional regulator [Flavobacterium sp. RHBU_3]|uniref:MerR family transcriptional regulator n=1 Tax=Flavobacterium sp. RHBU_3 TaxID=3391184 RepID=UPI003984AB12
MNKIKNTFTIKDLENLSGIKAHTIRIWEKRYGVLQPMRTDTNVRVYDTRNLQKLLNINTLNNFGYKISNIAKLPEERIPEMVKEIITSKTVNDHVLRNFKFSMMNFDTKLFLDTYNELLASRPFREIFYNCFIPLLEEVGNLWQTDTITPAHEHFISNLVKQKIMVNIEPLQQGKPLKGERTYVLYLPEGEIHEIGLMLINYELLYNGYHTVYLGESVPMEDLGEIKKLFDNISFITYMTVEPRPGGTNDYVSETKKQLLKDSQNEFILCGRCAGFVDSKQLQNNIKTYRSVKEFADTMQ